MLTHEPLRQSTFYLSWFAFKDPRWNLANTFRRWAGKTSYVHLAPEHEFTMKQKRRPE